jgi:ABC-type multidrug transport system fused ATPase/permease subunit
LIRRYSVQQARAKKAYDIVVADKLVIDKDNAKKLKIKEAEVVFDNVGFGYGDKAVFKKFDLSVKNGEKSVLSDCLALAKLHCVICCCVCTMWIMGR